MDVEHLILLVRDRREIYDPQEAKHRDIEIETNPYSPGTNSYPSAPTPTPTFTQDHNPPINDVTF